MPERGPVFVVAACITRGEEILLSQRNQPNNPLAHLRWELPGGKVQLEENPHQAIIREIREELDTNIELVRLLPHVQSNVYHTSSGAIHSIVIAFECKIPVGAPSPRPSESAVLMVRWIKKQDLDQINLLPAWIVQIEQPILQPTYLFDWSDLIRQAKKLTFGSSEQCLICGVK